MNIYKEIGNVVPEDVQAVADHISFEISNINWTLGDYVNLVYEYVRGNHLLYTKRDCASWAKNRMDTDDYSVDTLLYYSQVAQAFPVSVGTDGAREKYRHLPFSHFSVAKAAQGREIECLEYSSNFIGENSGWKMTAAKLRLKFVLGLEDAEPAHFEEAPFPQEDYVSGDFGNPLQHEARSALTSLQRLSARLKGDKTKSRSYTIISRLLHAVEELLSEVESEVDKVLSE